jgi:hypothetical protein
MKTLAQAVLGCVLAACPLSAAVASLVNYDKDLAGKQICWSAPAAAQDGQTAYSSGGKAQDSY